MKYNIKKCRFWKCGKKFLDIYFIKCRVGGFCSDECETEAYKAIERGLIWQESIK